MDTVTITRISDTKKGRIALFSGEEFLFSVDAETFAAEDLRTGQVLTESELETLRSKSESRKACDKALQYISLRDYASGELYQKLLTKFDEHSAAAAVAKMVSLGLLNDENFALHRVKYMLNQNKSRREIVQALSRKGVDRALVQNALDAVYDEIDAEGGPDPEVEAALRLLRKSYLRKLAEGKRDNVAAALYRRGFSSGAVREALARCEEEQREEQDEL